MASLDALDLELKETEDALRLIEEELGGFKTRDDGSQGKKDAWRVPGRCCRASDLPRRARTTTKHAGPAASEKRTTTTFGSAARFSRVQAEGDFLLNPVDDFLSTTTVAKGAVMHSEAVKPRQMWEAKRWLEGVAAQSHCKEATAILASQPGLLGLTAAWKALLREEHDNEDAFDFDADASTDAGSELPELLSVSSATSTATSSPGPGSYSPNYEVLRPSLAKGAPSFGRYSAREVPQEEERAETSEMGSRGTESALSTAPESFTCRGGKILPMHTTRPRRPTASQLDAIAAAARPLGPQLTKEQELLVAEEEEVKIPVVETGRLERLEKSADPAPGDYDLPSFPGGPSAVIAPPGETQLIKEEAPGPAQYDLRASEAHVYPRAVLANFGLSRPEVMEHQRRPDYIFSYEALDVNFTGIEPKIPAALILPEESPEALHAHQLLKHRAPAAGTGAKLGPGAYSEDDQILQRIRPDRMVLSWHPRREGLPEHLLGLFKHYTRFGRLRLDGRQLLRSEDDLALRRCRQRAFIQPPHRTLRRSWSAEDIWRLYLPKLDEPMGRNFARNLEFDEWQEKEKYWRWLGVRHFCRTRPSLRLSYSLPDLELVKDRAPEVDFSKGPGRPQAEEQEEVEGDVLLLSDDRRAVAPRVPQPVDMAKQLGRDTVDHDDFEELVLSPKRPMRRTSCFVDMAKEPGRPEKLELDPHIWAEEHERVFCYKPTLGEETDEMLDLSPASVQRRLLPRTPTYDWALCLGRPGHDPRLETEEEDGPILLTNWEAPFVAPATPRPPPLPPGEEVFLPSLHGLSVQEEPHVPEPPAPEPPEPPEPPAPPVLEPEPRDSSATPFADAYD